MQVSEEPNKRRNKGKVRNAIAYEHLDGRKLRPRGLMPISRHQEAGRIIRSVLDATPGLRGVQNRLNGVRSELDEWVMREFPKLPQPIFLSLYFEENATPLFRTDREGHLGRLKLMNEILTSSYPDCAPLRSLLKLVDRAIVMICARTD